MTDPYPSTLNIEIDRDRLRKYLRVKWLWMWTYPLSFFGILFGFAACAGALDDGITSRSDALLLVARCIATGIGISALIALVCYLIFSHRIASRLAASLEVSVEDAFLRVREHARVMFDRKLHFRSIVDYAVTQDSLMRYFGIHSLVMTTTAGGQNTNLIIPGVKDCLQVRDLLADIDRQRENQ